MIYPEIQLIECPRDAMQGWPDIIPTEKKIEYLQALLKVGFHTLDCGSFVSAKAIPQMADTKEVLNTVDVSGTSTKLLSIVLNERGAQDAVSFKNISYLGYPFSVSETFQQRNGNSSIEESFLRLQKIQEIAVSNNKETVVYLSMAFGNPYGDAYNQEIVFSWAERIAALGIQTISLADTIGVATPEQILEITAFVKNALTDITIGVHLHSEKNNGAFKLQAALQAGATRVDGAILGIGGCPMSGNDLVGNMDTESIVNYLKENKFGIHINQEQFDVCKKMAATIFHS